MRRMNVWCHDERKWREFGSERWQCSWESLTPSGEVLVAISQDIDPDVDVQNMTLAFLNYEDAKKYAKELIASMKTAFGQVTLTLQAVRWFVEEDRIAEWQDIGDAQYFDSGGDE